MNCSKTKELLSPFCDGELTSDVHASVESHVESCSVCAQELAEFQAMSQLARRMPDPQPAPDAWQALEARLDGARLKSAATPARIGRTLLSRRFLVAAALLIVGGIGLTLFLQHDEHDDHLAVNFDHYLEEFVQDTDEAQQVLASTYPNQIVDLEEAARQLKYIPAATQQLPNGYTLDAAYVFDMPCCKCIQCVYRRAGRSAMALFEHESDQPIWFGDRPAVECQCNGKSTRIVAFDGQLAASWPSGTRHLTLIGAKDIKQIMQVMDHLDADSEAKPKKPLGWRPVFQGSVVARQPTETRRPCPLHSKMLLSTASRY